MHFHSKTICITIIVIIIGFQAAQAQAKLKLKDGDTWDFKAVPEGPDITHDFEFENTGNAPLIIKYVIAASGAAIAKWPDQPILPGKKGIISVVMLTKGHKGYFYSSFSLTSNASNNKDYAYLYIKGIIASDTAVK